MRYNFEVSNIGMQQMLTTSCNPSYQRPQSAAELKQVAMQALSAWQEALKQEGDQEARLNEGLLSLAAALKDKQESAEIDQAIRKEWLERNKK